MSGTRQTIFGARIRQRNHAIKRCRERYGVALTLEDYTHLCDRLWGGTRGSGGRGVERIEGSHGLYWIWWQKVPFVVAWDEETCQIRTFLSRADKVTDRASIRKARGIKAMRRRRYLSPRAAELRC